MREPARQHRRFTVFDGHFEFYAALCGALRGVGITSGKRQFGLLPGHNDFEKIAR